MTKKKILVIIAIIVLILIVSGLAWFILYGGQNDSAQKVTDNNTPSKVETVNKSAMAYIESQKDLNNFKQLLRATSVGDTLNDTSAKYVVIAPYDKAFDTLPSGYLKSLINGDKTSIAPDITKYHIASFSADQLATGQKLKTLQGQEVIVGKSGQRLTFTSAKGDVATTQSGPIKVTNGSIYIVDAVMLPQ